jgi:signal transduction histidine kinase
MAAVTGLGAGFAHEINNPLTAVIGLTQVLMRRAKQRGRTEELEVLDHVVNEAHRIRKTVRTLLSLSQNHGGESYAELDVNALVEESLALLEPKLAEAQIDVVRHLQDGVPRIRGNKAQLREVLLNVFNNSRAAMVPAGGKLTLSTGAIAGQVVRIEIQDTGRGIAPEHLEKIFDPFFTTKDEWRSEGLGLTVASRVVEQHKGRIQVQSEVGKGTTLTITLPAAPARAHLA